MFYQLRLCLLLVLGTACCSARSIHVKAFPAAIFSPEKTKVLYLEFQMDAYVDPPILSWLSKLDLACIVALEGCNSPAVHVTVAKERIYLRSLDIAQGSDSILYAVPPPPWIGCEFSTRDGGWFHEQEVRLLLSPEGEPELEIHGPLFDQHGKISIQEDWVWSRRNPNWHVVPRGPFSWHEVPTYFTEVNESFKHRGSLVLIPMNEYMGRVWTDRQRSFCKRKLHGKYRSLDTDQRKIIS